MRYWAVFFGGVAALVASSARGQSASSQVTKEFALGQAVAKDIDRTDGRIDDASITDYLQRIANRTALAAGVKPVEVRLTRSTLWSANLLPNSVLYLSGGMLARIENEAEFAGLLAHEMAHGP
jgi:predicted Zn-dependent protease